MADEQPLGIEQRVYLERVRIFFRHTAGSLLRALLAMFFIALSLYYADVPYLHISVWAVVFAAVTAAIVMIERKFDEAKLDHRNARSQANRRVGAGILFGLLLGVGGFLAPAEGALVSQLLMFIVLITGVGLMCVSYTTMPAYSIGVAIASMGLLAVSFLRAHDHIHYTMTFMAVVATLLLARKAVEVSRTAIEGIRINEQLKDEIERRHGAERDADRARREAERANTAKSNFLANMSHELRTPMNAVIGFSGALKSGIAGPLTEKQSEYLEDIHSSGEHLLTLINDLLDLSKIEAGELRIEEEEFDFTGEISRCIRLLREQAGSSGIALVAEIPDAMPRLRADRRLVGQMVLNLLSNAMKFTPEGGQVKVLARNGSGGVAVSVSDTGCGMAPEDISIALLPFGQVESGTAIEGTGLGLPLVKQMAELHGGDLSIESAPGEGTTATISFPPDRVVAG